MSDSPPCDQNQLTESEWGFLSTSIRAGYYAFFVGAGVSTEAGLPTASGLIRLMLSALYRKSPTEEAADTAFRTEYSFDDEITLGGLTQAIENRMGREKLISLLSNCFRWDVAPANVHRALAQLSILTADNGRPLRVITPNYDGLIQDGIGLRNHDVIVDGPQHRGARDGVSWVFKVHGCLRHEPVETVVITNSDIAKQLPDWKVTALEGCTRGRGLIVMGYSGGDSHLNRMIAEAVSKSDTTTYEPYWVSPDPPIGDALDSFAGHGQHLSIHAAGFLDNLGLQGSILDLTGGDNE